MNKRLLNVGLIVLIDMLGFALIVPLLAFFADSFGATAFQTGLLVASYAAMQMISAPILGRISDRFGRRPVFLISIFGNLYRVSHSRFCQFTMDVVRQPHSFRPHGREYFCGASLHRRRDR